MSKYMQITVTVRPFYQGELKETFPKLARHLGYLDQELVHRNPSLYDLAARLDKLLYAYDGTQLREVLLKHRQELQDLQRRTAEEIADWNLAQADKLLYRIEDIFEDIEAELNQL
jgi:primosomal protein N''